MFGITPREETLLLALSGKRLYGLEIQDLIAKASRGDVDIKIGSLYPALHDLEAKGFVVSSWGEERNEGARRKYYELTQEGEGVLKRIEGFRERLSGSKGR